MAITCGDGGGIGPEIILKAHQEAKFAKKSLPLVLGNGEIFQRTLKRLKLKGLRLDVFGWRQAAQVISVLKRRLRRPGEVFILDAGQKALVKPGRPSAAAGRLAVFCLRLAVQLCQNGLAQALVTSPLSKTSLKLAGCGWPGHTEMLAEFTGTKKFRMMFVSPKLKVILATIHQPLKSVSQSLSISRIFDTIELGAETMKLLGVARPRLAVAGLNPHAGEGGLFGDEEKKFIIPAIKKARARGIMADGPFPPDTLFLPKMLAKYDLFVCLYHDQGLISLKMTAFDRAVNVTAGLPFPRTSPDHGTAFDIAGLGLANPSSFLCAYRLAEEMSRAK